MQIPGEAWRYGPCRRLRLRGGVSRPATAPRQHAACGPRSGRPLRICGCRRRIVCPVCGASTAKAWAPSARRRGSWRARSVQESVPRRFAQRPGGALGQSGRVCGLWLPVTTAMGPVFVSWGPCARKTAAHVPQSQRPGRGRLVAIPGLGLAWPGCHEAGVCAIACPAPPVPG